MIGGPIGEPIGPPIPAGQIFEQEISISASGGVALTRDTGKNVAIPADGLVAFGNFAIAKGVSIAANGAVAVTKAVDFTLGRVLASGLVSVTKNVGKIVPRAFAAGIVALRPLNIGKVVSVPVRSVVSAVVATLFIASTDIIQKPVNFFLAKTPPFKDRFRTMEGDPRITTQKETRRVATPTRRLSGGKPSFTSKTRRGGHD